MAHKHPSRKTVHSTSIKKRVAATKRRTKPVQRKKHHGKQESKQALCGGGTPFDVLAFLIAVAVFLVLLPGGDTSQVSPLQPMHGAATIEQPCAVEYGAVTAAKQALVESERFLHRTSERYNRECTEGESGPDCGKFWTLFQNASDEVAYRMQVIEWAEGDYEKCMGE